MPGNEASLLARYHHPLVRDLTWLLLAPDLLAMPWPGRPSRQALGLGGAERLTRWLDAQEAQPAPLEARVGGSRQGRLGRYHEHLWQFLLEAAPSTELLTHNLRVMRGKRTLGELDLLYRHVERTEVVHLEVAIKFYLGLPEGPGERDNPARWIGPGGVDSLAGKREHLHRHQLRLTELPEAQDALQALPWRGTDAALPVAPRLAMPGVLFYPWHALLPPPSEAHPAHLRGHWLHWRAWERYRHDLAAGSRGTRLVKPHWLALPRREQLLTLTELDAWLGEHFRTPASPVQLALWQPGRGWQRLFVVADDWPRQIPLPPMAAPHG